jgi:hypothetical protein
MEMNVALYTCCFKLQIDTPGMVLLLNLFLKRRQHGDTTKHNGVPLFPKMQASFSLLVFAVCLL